MKSLKTLIIMLAFAGLSNVLSAQDNGVFVRAYDYYDEWDGKDYGNNYKHDLEAIVTFNYKGVSGRMKLHWNDVIIYAESDIREVEDGGQKFYGVTSNGDDVWVCLYDAEGILLIGEQGTDNIFRLVQTDKFDNRYGHKSNS